MKKSLWFTRLLLCFFTLLFVSKSYAQVRRDFTNISYFAVYYSPYVGDFYYSGGLHLTKYNGELGSFIGKDKTTQRSGLRYNLSVGYQITNYVSARFDIHRYKIGADDVRTTDSTTRWQGFDATNMDYSINLIHDLTAKSVIDRGEKLYSPYLLLGLGLSSNNGVLNTDGVNVDQFPGSGAAETSGKISVIMPLGIGVKYYILHNLNIAFEMRSALVLADKIDEAGKIRGNSKSKDSYVSFGFKATWQKSYKFDYRQYKKRHYHL